MGKPFMVVDEQSVSQVHTREAARNSPIPSWWCYALVHVEQNRLVGKIHDAQGHAIAWPGKVLFIGRNKPHRGDSKWVNGWSPEQIAKPSGGRFPR